MNGQKFEDRLLTELKTVVAGAPEREIGHPRRWKGRLAAAAALVAAAVTAVVVLPIGGRGPGVRPAYAVTENDDGTVTVEIRSIRDDEGLERKIEEAGIPASVHYLPQDKVCAPPGFEARTRGDSTRMEREEAAMEVMPVARGAVRVRERNDGAFVFTIDKKKLEPDYTVIVFAEDDVPEHGQNAATVASIATGVVKGDYYEECTLVDGSIEGWGFQQGAPPTMSDEEKAARARERGDDQPGK